LTKEELKEWIKRRGIVVVGGAGALAKARKEGKRHCNLHDWHATNYYYVDLLSMILSAPEADHPSKEDLATCLQDV
jgi:hypothetical protein